MTTRSMLLSVAALSVALWPASAHADPELFVTSQGVNDSGNHQWQVAVAPDPAFFSEGGDLLGSSLAVELAFEIEGSTIVDIVENTTDWPFDNPGNNPFTDSVTDGTWISDDGDRAFTAYGGNFFTTGDPVPLFSMQTLGSDPTMVHYGEAASGDEVDGATIAQTGENFTTGSMTLLEFMAQSEGALGTASGGSTTMFFHGFGGSVQSIPEPAAGVLVAVGLALASWFHRRR